MATYQELMSQKAALEKQAAALQDQIETARRNERSEVLAQIRSLMQTHGVTLAELGGAGRRSPRAAKAAKAPKAGSTGRKVAPKFRNPATGDTWSGRGLRPNWLKAALASGKKIEDFAI